MDNNYETHFETFLSLTVIAYTLYSVATIF